MSFPVLRPSAVARMPYALQARLRRELAGEIAAAAMRHRVILAARRARLQADCADAASRHRRILQARRLREVLDVEPDPESLAGLRRAVLLAADPGPDQIHERRVA